MVAALCGGAFCFGSSDTGAFILDRDELTVQGLAEIGHRRQASNGQAATGHQLCLQ